MKKIFPKYCELLYQWFPMYKLRLEYGENKIVVCHISKDSNMLRKKAYKDVINLSELEKYGFSKDLYGRSVAEHKCVARDKYIRENCFETSIREIVFVLKDGRNIPFESANFSATQLHNLVVYIEQNTGIQPLGTLRFSLLTAEFSNEKIDFIYDSVLFSKEKLQDVELRIVDIYFTNEAVAICRPDQVAYIPYDKLLAISFLERRSMHYDIISLPYFSCCFWLKNGRKCGCKVDKKEDFERISAYMKLNHHEIEADSELIYAGAFY